LRRREFLKLAGVSLASTISMVGLEPALSRAESNETPTASVDFSLRFWVDFADPSQRPWPKPYVRGLDHLVFAGFDVGSSMLADLRTRRVIGRFSAGMAADSTYWRTVIFPMLLSIVAGSVGVVELHASCVATGQQGVLLLGPSHSGKSTLAMALTEAGFKFLTDDRTFCSVKRKKLTAWGLPRPLKLRRDSGSFFYDFRDREPRRASAGFAALPDEGCGLAGGRRAV